MGLSLNLVPVLPIVPFLANVTEYKSLRTVTVFILMHLLTVDISQCIPFHLYSLLFHNIFVYTCICISQIFFFK